MHIGPKKAFSATKIVSLSPASIYAQCFSEYDYTEDIFSHIICKQEFSTWSDRISKISPGTIPQKEYKLMRNNHLDFGVCILYLLSSEWRKWKTKYLPLQRPAEPTSTYNSLEKFLSKKELVLQIYMQIRLDKYKVHQGN